MITLLTGDFDLLRLLNKSNGRIGDFLGLRLGLLLGVDMLYRATGLLPVVGERRPGDPTLIGGGGLRLDIISLIGNNISLLVVLDTGDAILASIMSPLSL